MDATLNMLRTQATTELVGDYDNTGFFDSRTMAAPTSPCDILE